MKRICLISDMHCGSDVAIAYPQTLVSKDPLSILKLNAVQREFYDKWKKLEKSEPYDAIFVLGDCVDGTNFKSQGVGTWTTNLAMQSLCAARGIMSIPLKEGGKIGIIGGSGYHGGSNPDMDNMVANVINSLGGNAEYWGLDKFVNIEGVKLHLCHAISNGFYLGNSLNKELLLSHIYKLDCDGVIRGHLHSYYKVEDAGRFGLMLPGWKGRDDYVRKAGLRWAKTSIGWVDLNISGNETETVRHVWKIENNIPEVRL